MNIREAQVLAYYVEAQQEVAKIEAMKVANIERQGQGLSLVYDEKAFAEKMEHLAKIALEMHNLAVRVEE